MCPTPVLIGASLPAQPGDHMDTRRHGTVNDNKNLTGTAAPQPDYSGEIAAIVRSNLTPKRMRERVLDYHENDIALALEQLTRDERSRLYNVLDADSLAGILEYAEEPADYLRELSIRRQAAVLSRFESSEAVEALRKMDKGERASLLELMEPEARSEISLLSSFDEDEIGSRMSTNYIEITAGSSVKEAMASLVKQAAENDNVTTLYVVDNERTFCGAIDLKDLIIAREGTSLDDITTYSYPYVYADSDAEDCMRRLKDYSEDSIPVLDSDNKLIGVITAQDMVEAVEDELGEDYARLAGLSSEEDLAEPIRRSVRKRLPWLIILLGLGLVVSAVVGVFEPVVAQLTIIMSFQSLILDMAGNVGTQSLAVTIRVLMDEQISARQKLGLIWKEARVGLFNGFILGVLSFAVVGLYLHLAKGNPLSFSFAISGCIALALILAMVISSVSGTAIPLFFQKIKVDPAVASGPLITTINDLVAVVAYYGLAWLLLINTLHLV